MNGTWWDGPSELDDDQRNIISLPLDNSVLVTTPSHGSLIFRTVCENQDRVS
jgi:hypothetical protein